MPRPKKDYSFTPEKIEILLSSLAADRETAVRKLAELWRALEKSFEHNDRGGVLDPVMAYDVLERVATRIQEGVYVENVPAYAQKVAAMVRQEEFRKSKQRSTALRRLTRGVGGFLRAPARAYRTVPEIPELLRDYYSSDATKRQDMAGQLGITDNALRIRVHNIVKQLRDRGSLKCFFF